LMGGDDLVMPASDEPTDFVSELEQCFTGRRY